MPFHPVQLYALNLVPLCEADRPHVHFVWVADESENYVGYHPVGSWVQLSSSAPDSPLLFKGGDRNKKGGNGVGGG